MGRKAYSTIKKEKDMALSSENLFSKEEKIESTDPQIKTGVITSDDVKSGKKKFFVPGVRGGFLGVVIDDDHFVEADEKTAEELKKHFKDVKEVPEGK